MAEGQTKMRTVVIAAPHSGSGKTTIALGIMAALKRRGLRVAPYKVGPDFIDPGHHESVTGVPSVNLDGWMCGKGFLRDTFERSAEGADFAVIEGVMGLFDGIDGTSEAGSTAQIAKLLGAPVILVVDARSQARSAAALLHGFATFDPEVRIAAVVFNNVASANHERILCEAVASTSPDICVLGCIEKDAALAIPSRHLGLCTAHDNPLSKEFVAQLARTMEENLDLDALVGNGGKCCGGLFLEAGFHNPAPSSDAEWSNPAAQAPVRIAVARDAAFCFAYPDNLRLLQESGAELCFFSPLSDPVLPEAVSGLYLPGGYPELFAETLAANLTLKEEINEAVEGDMPVYAECGGFIYLTEGVAVEGSLHPFVGVFPVSTRMLPRRKALGYREVELLDDSVIGTTGSVARGHEFHYSEMDEMPPHVERIYRVNRKGVVLQDEGFRYKNCLASYIHLHFGSSPTLAKSFMQHCRTYNEGSLNENPA
jgi:cobyrinic acid a,c-diamide synthase